MAQLKEDEWPEDREPTTTEREVAGDPEHGPKDPDDPRRPQDSDELREGLVSDRPRPLNRTQGPA